jgi:hypothetical protein
MQTLKSKPKILAETLEIVFRIVSRDLEKLNLADLTLYLYLFFTDFLNQASINLFKKIHARRNIN